MDMIKGNMKEILDNLYDGVYIVDRDRRIRYWNKAAEELTGYTSGELLGSCCNDNILNHVDETGNKLCTEDCPLIEAINGVDIDETKVFLHHRNGHRVPTLVKAIPYRDSRGEVVGAIEIFSENSERKNILKKIKELEKLAMLDELTQIPNRRYMENILEMKLNEYRLSGVEFGVIFMDIDYFKRFNDDYGHGAGDLVLKTISSTFSNNLRGDDIVGRWGGEEFIGVFSRINDAGLKSVAEKLRVLAENTSVKIVEEELRVTVSSGATLVEPEDSVDTLMERVDDLLYRSKRAGRNRVTLG